MAAGATAISLGKQGIEAAAEKGTSRARLRGALGSDVMADFEMSRIEEFSKKTPFEINDLREAFTKLASFGMKPTNIEMKQLGDVAAFSGKKIDQLAEALLDAKTGEFRRLEDFHIKTKQKGDELTLTFRNQETTIKNTSAAIENYILNLGNAEGVMGSMSRMNEEMGGKLNQLGNAWEGLMERIGDTKLISKATSKTTDFLNYFSRGLDIGHTGANLTYGEKVSGRFNPYGEAGRKFDLLEQGSTNKVIARGQEEIPRLIKYYQETYKKKSEDEVKAIVKSIYTDRLSKASEELHEASKSLYEFKKAGGSATDIADYERKKTLLKNEIAAYKELSVSDLFNKKTDNSDPKGGFGGDVPGVISDGKASRNLTINIDKLIEQVTVQSQTIEGGATNVAEELKKALLTAVNDVNYAVR